jgi:hypothetical protein
MVVYYRPLDERRKAMLHHNLPSQSGFNVIQKEAKKLLHSLQRKDITAIERYDPFTILDDVSHARLADAQYLIARRLGFKSWASMKEQLVKPVLKSG